MPAVPVYLKVLLAAMNRVDREPVTGFSNLGNALVVCHQTPVDRSWPRRFLYHVEWLETPDDLVASLDAQPSPTGNHFLHVLARKLPPSLTKTLEIKRWLCVQTNLLLAYSLSEYSTARRFNEPGSEIEIAPLLADRRPHVGGESLIYLHRKKVTLSESPIYAFLAYVEGEPAGIVQAVMLTAHTGYLLDLFTRPGFRRRGIGNALVRFIHEFYFRKGAETMVVMPTRMTRQSGFYLNLGYEPAVEINMYVSYLAD